MMSAIFFELALISPMVCTTWRTTSPPRWATAAAELAIWLAWAAASALWATVWVSWVTELAVCCRLEAVASVRWLRSWLPVAISLLAVEMLSALCRTSPTRLRRASVMRARARCTSPISSARSGWIWALRSPLAMRSARLTA